MKKLQAVLFGLAISWVSGVLATTYNTATPTSSSLFALGAKLYCNSGGCTSVQPGNMTGYVTLSAWSTPTAAGSTTTSPTDTGSWMQAQLAIYSGGIGISNQPQAATECFGCTPQHAIDNKIVDDILVVDFGSTGWDVSSFSLGYVCHMTSAGTGCSTTTTTVGVQAWIGGQDGSIINFATESFNGNGLTATPTTGNFTALSLNPDPVTANVAINDSSSTLGRYLIITGALGSGTINGTSVNGYSDAFKVKDIVAVQTPGGPGGSSVPTPGSFALLALGLFALTIVRRRVAAIA